MEINKAHIDTLPLLYTLEQQIFDAESYPLSKRSLKTQIQKGNVYLATIDEKIAGYLLVFRYKYTMRIYSLGILSAYRKQRIGQSLITFIIHQAKKEGYRTLSLEVNTSNHPAIELYAKLAFQPIKTLKNYYPNGDGLKMVLPLK